MKGFVKDSSNSLDSNRERVAFTIFLVDNIYIYIYIYIYIKPRKNNNIKKEMLGEMHETRTQ